MPDLTEVQKLEQRRAQLLEQAAQLEQQGRQARSAADECKAESARLRAIQHESEMQANSRGMLEIAQASKAAIEEALAKVKDLAGQAKASNDTIASNAAAIDAAVAKANEFVSKMAEVDALIAKLKAVLPAG